MSSQCFSDVTIVVLVGIFFVLPALNIKAQFLSLDTFVRHAFVKCVSKDVPLMLLHHTVHVNQPSHEVQHCHQAKVVRLVA